MKKLLLVLSIILVSALLFGCNKNNKNNNNPTYNTNERTTNNDVTSNVEEEEKEEYFSGTVEYDKPDFTDKTDFKVEKSEDLQGSSYDNIFLLDRDTAQLDLKFSNNRVATLMVSKMERFVTDSSATSSSIAGVTVTNWTEVDNIKHYTWEKDGFYFEFATMDDFSTEELTNVINGYKVEMEAR